MSQLDMTEVYKMENESDGVTDTADNQKLCEFCMQLVGNDFTYIHDEEIASIQKIFPEMNMNIVKNPVVCTQCCDSLSTYNVFRKKCFNVDEKIENINEISADCKPINELPRDLLIKSECLDEELEMSLKSEPIEIKLEENGVESNTPFCLNDETTKNSNCKDTDKAHENASETCDQPDFINKWKRKVSEECEYKSKSKSNVTIDTTKAKDRNILYKCDMCDYKTKRQYLLGKHQLEHEKYLEVVKMGEKRVIKFSMVSALFSEDIAQLELGEDSYSNGNVIKMSFDSSVTPALLKGEVKGTKGKKFSVELSVDAEDGITEAKCTCPKGQEICHHMAALCIHAHHNVTDKACSCNAPTNSKMEETKSLKEMFPSKKKNYSAVKRKATAAEIVEFKKKLESEAVGFTWFLQTEREVASVPQIDNILFSLKYIASKNKIEYFKERCTISKEKIMKIAEATCGQSRNEKGLKIRKYRLTSNHFGAVIASCKGNQFPPSLYNSLLENYNSNSLAVQWEREKEQSAIETFKAATGMEVSPTGLWLDECGYLAASPDGFVEEDALIEVKCPYEYKSVSLENALRKDKTYIIYKNEEGETTVNRNHIYWDQIQGKLHIANKEICFLVVWTPTECEIIEIEKCDDWKENIDLLKTFYLNNFIPYITNKKA